MSYTTEILENRLPDIVFCPHRPQYSPSKIHRQPMLQLYQILRFHLLLLMHHPSPIQPWWLPGILPLVHLFIFMALRQVLD